MKFIIEKINKKLEFELTHDGFKNCWTSNVLELLGDCYVFKIFKYHNETTYKTSLYNIGSNLLKTIVIESVGRKISTRESLEEAKNDCLEFLKSRIELLKEIISKENLNL
jgi:hypothetical protein